MPTPAPTVETTLTSGVGHATQAPAPDTWWMQRLCNVEDEANCFWNAGEAGNKRGHSFYARKFPGGLVCVMYLNRKYAKKHDECTKER